YREPFRKMFPTSDGQMITIQKGDSLHFDWAYPIDPVYTVGQLYTTIWVQNRTVTSIPGKQRNKVLQSAQAKAYDPLAAVPRGVGGADGEVWLGQNTPNPFKGGTTIAFAVSHAGNARLSVYSATGQLVTTLADGHVEPGAHTATWNGQDRFGKSVGSGMYYYRLDTPDGTRNGRMVFLK
ncbi:MAG TPA: FlgD immunoglobulin-like domain containing protein, partial [bacterium]|nr:FlgD immunoglobulin-like domain containing protein [bacterium]